MHKYQSLIVIVIAAVALLLGVRFAAGAYSEGNQKRAEVEEARLRSEAVQGCTEFASNVEEGIFIPHLYRLCVRDKGYQASVQE